MLHSTAKIIYAVFAHMPYFTNKYNAEQSKKDTHLLTPGHIFQPVVNN